MRITQVETDLLRIPLRRAVSLPGAQDPRSAKEVDVLIVRLLTDSQFTGLGIAYTFHGGPALKSILDSLIAPLLLGEDPARSEWLFLKASHELSTLGFTGAVARAYAAADFALWDLKGQAANLPVHQLLGGYRTKLKAIVSDTATPALGVKQAVKETRTLLDRGAAGVQIEVGTADPDVDVDRLRQILEALPEGPWIEVSAAGRYDSASALWMGRAFEQEFGVDSYLDPLRPDDFNGLKCLCERLELSLGVGAYFDRVDDFVRAIDLGGISTLRIDPLRIGGITPARKIALAAELKQIAIAPVRLPEIGVHLAAGVVYGRVCEYVDWFAQSCSAAARASRTINSSPRTLRASASQSMKPLRPNIGFDSWRRRRCCSWHRMRINMRGSPRAPSPRRSIGSAYPGMWFAARRRWKRRR